MNDSLNHPACDPLGNPAKSLKVILCEPRGFCAGVMRAVTIVNETLQRIGPPVYVRHQIVHNRYVVDGLRKKGAVFIESLEEIPPENRHRPVILSAHGVPKSVHEYVRHEGLNYLDATCPLVKKVHKQAQLHEKRGRHVLLIGHAGHPEVVGTLGQIGKGSITLIETCHDAENFAPPKDVALAYTTQTTLSIDDTAEIIAILKKRFPDIAAPHGEDICYATTNRQIAVKNVAPRVDAMIVVGSTNSSNSQRLREAAAALGCRHAYLIDRADAIDWQNFPEISSLGITAGASAPEILVEEVIDAFSQRYQIDVEHYQLTREDVVFPLPRDLHSFRH